MFVSKLEIHGIKRLRNFALDFTRSDGSPRMWTVLLGENGLCKTTILQAVAMCATGYVRANQMADVPSLPDVRLGPNDRAIMRAVFQFGHHRHATRDYPDYPGSGTPRDPPSLFSELTIGANESTLSGSSAYQHLPTTEPTDPLKAARSRTDVRGWFVAGFGTARFLPRPQASDRLEDPVLSRLNPLFDKGRLVGTGFADVLEDPKAFASLLREALIEDKLLPDASNIELRGKGGVTSAKRLVESHRFDFKVGKEQLRIPATWLSQGYQSTIAWVADVIGHMLLDSRSEEIELADMEGLVLVDELDLHLHPRWQRTIVAALKEIFPRVQFVATTHSPMVLAGLRRDEVVLLSADDAGNITSQEAPDEPSVLTGSELYREFFGVQNFRPELGVKLQQYGYLVGNPHRTDSDDRNMRKLQEELREAGIDPGWTAVRRSKQRLRKA